MNKFSMKKLIVCALAATTAATALCACGSSNEKKYTVTFDTRGGSAISSLSLTAGSTISRPSKAPTRQWSVFDDWYTDTTFTQKFEFGTKMPKYNITIYANWYGEANINVTYDANGGLFDGGNTITEDQGNVGATFTPITTDPKKDGYVFGGWYTDPECTTSYSFTVYPSEDLVLYAGWAHDNEYAYVSYYGNGSLVKTVPVKKGEVNTEAKIFDDGLINTGWYTDKTLTTQYSFGDSITSDIDLYTSYYTDGLVIDGNTVTGYYGSSRAVVVPNIYNGTEITVIGEEAFYRSSAIIGITSVALPDTVVKISNRAFYDCRYLVNAGLPNSVTEIGDYAFYRNERLKSVGDISSVKSIGQGAFQGCKVIQEIALPATLESMGSYAFEGCASLASITVPAKVATIGEYTFSGCSALVTADIMSSGLNEIEAYAFEGCTALTSLIIRSGAMQTTFKTSQSGVGAIDDCANVTIYVPSIYLELYKADNPEFADKFTAI